MTERAIVLAITRYLNSREDVWFFKTHGAAFQVAGLPDLIGCCQGRCFGLEVKRPGESATPLQQATLRRMAACGALTGVVTSVDEVRALMPAVRITSTDEIEVSGNGRTTATAR